MKAQLPIWEELSEIGCSIHGAWFRKLLGRTWFAKFSSTHYIERSIEGYLLNSAWMEVKKKVLNWQPLESIFSQNKRPFPNVKEIYPAFFDLWRAVCQNHCKTHVDEHGAVSYCPSFEEVATKCIINHSMCLLLIVISSCLCALPWRCRGHKCIVKVVFVFSKFSPFYFLHFFLFD